MKTVPLDVNGFRLLSPGAFETVLAAELKRAARAQTFLTLVAVEARRVWDGLTIAADDGTLAELAEILRHEVRDTDLMACGPRSILWLILLDADAPDSQAVIDRVVGRIDGYRFSTSVSVAVGAACCPTHAVDPESLMRLAISRPLIGAGPRLHPTRPLETT